MLSYHFEGVPRGPLGVALKNILTLGIHTKVWLYRINREMDGHEGFHIDLRWLGVMVAVPIITPIIVKFQTARRMNQMLSHQVTVPLIRANRLGWLSIIPVFGAGFYAWWVQDSLNKHWFHHRREERIRLAKDRIANIATEPEPSAELVAKRADLESEVARLEREVAEEVEAARIRWGEERFNDRQKRADLHAAQGARMSRKELAELRAEEKRHRKAEKASKKAARGRLFGLLPPKAGPDPGEAAGGRDPENDADWQPQTPLPERLPDDIRAVFEGEEREPTSDEKKELKAAEKQVAKREKEEERLEKQRARLRDTLEKERAKAEKKAEKRRLAEEKAKANAARKSQKAKKPAKAKDAPGKQPKKGKAGKKGKTGKGEPPVEKIPVEVKPRTLRAPPTVHEAGEGPLRTLTVTCPRCRTEIRDIKKRGDAPAKITCPTCSLVGKV